GFEHPCLEKLLKLGYPVGVTDIKSSPTVGYNSSVRTMSSDDSVVLSPPTGASGKKGGKIEDIYQKKTQLEHILLRPDTYIGSVEAVTEQQWVIDDGKAVLRQVTYVPGLYKIFDEILVNAADNKQRDKNMDCIKIDIDQENNSVSIWNNGQGIPVVHHEKEKMYVPTMIFGHLLTSSNFNDEERKVTGGRNGYGAKLCNVFSQKFVVETAAKKYKRAFKQTWENNMSKAQAPKIKDFGGDDYTRVTFQPDLAKFKMESLDNDIVAIFQRRAYDVAASGGIKVFLNGKRLPIKNFKDYVDMFLKEREDEAGNPVKFQYEKCNDRWEVAVCPSDNGFQQISFVNSIATTKGGRHVEYVADMLIKHLTEAIKKKNKNGLVLKPAQIKNHLWVFVNCLIENPTFDSQTKENMTLQVKSFGSKCQPTDAFYAKILKSGIVENVLTWAKFKAENILDKKQSGKKTNKLKGIPKLEDANDAGGRNSLECTLILTEGDSAKTLAVAGLGVVGRDRYGVFPLRGKLLNVREASHKQILENAEINALVKIIGLKYKQNYDTMDAMKSLRYGKMMIMTDQDHDGSHIKGLIINFIHHNWPSLLKMNFMEEFITPIVKVSKGNRTIAFYSIPEMEEWMKSEPAWKTWRVKYYKGLGTSTSKEAKEYFSDMQRHRIKFKYEGSRDDDQITMAFSKKCIEQRKDWLTNWMEGIKARKEMGMAEDIIYSKDVKAISYSDFINKELILFSNLDNERSIPSLVDGLKPGQRKVLYTCMKRNDKREVKVAQLAGSVAEHSAYHHGEQSLMSTIIGLAQNFVGSNNINLLQPIGQFGTRLQGGKDSASPRYIFTMLSTLARYIYDEKDDPILKYLFDDNQKIEPEWYIPLIPMVLVNGADGIGTGWMTKIPNFNPREIVSNIRRLLDGDEPYACNGVVSLLNDTRIEITELPIATWTQAYKEGVMETYLQGSEKQPAMISDYKEYHTDTTVKFVVTMKDEQLDKYQNEGLHKVFKLQTGINLTSMVLFDKSGCLRKYNSVMDIMREHFDLRLEFYKKRRDFLLGQLGAETAKLSNQARFILEKCEGKLVVENKKKQAMIDELRKGKYDPDPIQKWKEQQNKMQQEEEDVEESGKKKDVDDADKKNPYNYLLGMNLWSLTLENKEALLKKRDEKIHELNLLKKKTPEDLYTDDLDKFIVELDRVEQAEKEDESSSDAKKKGAKAPIKNRKAYMEVAPSPAGKKVAPNIDDMIKKADAVLKSKENKGKRGPKKKDEKPVKEEKDEFDMMADDCDTSLHDKVSPDTSPKKAPAKRAAGGGRKKADGMKQTKLAFSKADKKQSPKKKGRGKKGSESEDEISEFSGSDMDFDDAPPPPRAEPARARSQRAVASVKKVYVLDEDDEDEPFKSDSEGGSGNASDSNLNKNGRRSRSPPSGSESEIDEPAPKKKKIAVAAKPKTAYDDSDGSDFDDEPIAKKKKPAPKSKAIPESDSEYDEPVVKKKTAASKPKSKPAAKPKAAPKSKQNGNKKTEDSDIEIDAEEGNSFDFIRKKAMQREAEPEPRNKNLAKYVFESDDYSD
ncbi:DNA topoisomerase 2-alpha, partial [Orchesella cincta]